MKYTFLLFIFFTTSLLLTHMLWYTVYMTVYCISKRGIIIIALWKSPPTQHCITAHHCYSVCIVCEGEVMSACQCRSHKPSFPSNCLPLDQSRHHLWPAPSLIPISAELNLCVCVCACFIYTRVNIKRDEGSGGSNWKSQCMCVCINPTGRV